MATSKDTVAYVLEQLEPLDVRAMRTRHLAAAQKPSAVCGQDAEGSAEAPTGRLLRSHDQRIRICRSFSPEPTHSRRTSPPESTGSTWMPSTCPGATES